MSAASPPRARPARVQDFRDAWFVGYTGHLVAGVWLGNDDNSATKKLTGGGMPVDIWSRFMKVAHQGLPMADLPGMAGRSYEPQPSPSVSAPTYAPPANPLTSLLGPPQTNAAVMSREDDMRPPVAAPLPRPPVALAPAPAAQQAPVPPRAPAPRPPQVAAAPLKQAPPPSRSAQPPSRVTSAPLPLASAPPTYVAPPQPQYAAQQRMAAAPASTSSIPRPPGAVGGGGGYAPEPQQTSNSGSGVGNFFNNLFGQR